MIFFKQLLVPNELIVTLYLIKYIQNLFSAYQKAYFDVKKQLQFERDTAKYEETITELKQKGQIKKFKQIFYWSTLKPNILNKTAIQNKNDSEEQHLCS